MARLTWDRHRQRLKKRGVFSLGKICGHKAFIHGGFSAALFDELFGYQFGTLNREAKLGKINFTGNLVVDYRLPLPKNGTYLVRLW